MLTTRYNLGETLSETCGREGYVLPAVLMFGGVTIHADLGLAVFIAVYRADFNAPQHLATYH